MSSLKQMAFLRLRKDEKEACSALYDLVSEVIRHHCLHILFIRSKSWHQSTLKERELSPSSWREECQQIFGYILKLPPPFTQSSKSL